jgi:hypothetical protein
MPAPAAPPTVAPVKVPQPPIASASKQRPQIDVVIHLKRSVIGHLLRGSNAQNMFHDSRRATGDFFEAEKDIESREVALTTENESVWENLPV